MFARVRGTSIHQYRQSVRLRHALALILDTTWPLARIAAEAGYANQGHMCNHFRRVLRSQPSALRKPEGLRQLIARRTGADGG